MSALTPSMLAPEEKWQRQPSERQDWQRVPTREGGRDE